MSTSLHNNSLPFHSNFFLSSAKCCIFLIYLAGIINRSTYYMLPFESAMAACREVAAAGGGSPA